MSHRGAVAIIKELRVELGDLCHWCGRQMVFDPSRYDGKSKLGSNSATVEHLLPLSIFKLPVGQKHPIVLACNRCNTSRGVSQDWIPWNQVIAGKGLKNYRQWSIILAELTHGAHFDKKLLKSMLCDNSEQVRIWQSRRFRSRFVSCKYWKEQRSFKKRKRQQKRFCSVEKSLN